MSPIPYLAGLLLACAPLLAQDAFEVATLKLSPPPPGDSININLGAIRDDRLSMANITLGDMIKFAYEIVSDDQVVIPEENRSVRFDIEAKAKPGTPIASIRKMLQTLLSERLSLRLRREQRVLPHLALVVDAKEPRLGVSRMDAMPGPQVRGRIDHPRMSMGGLATLLSRFERQTVIDRTGLQGLYEVKLQWSPDPTAEGAVHPSLFTAVREQLGLRLESRRAPLEVLIVGRASREPTPN